jgi:hypothetical protein
MLNEIERGHGIELFSDLLEFYIELFVEEVSESGCGTPSLGISLEVGLLFDSGNGVEGYGLLGMRNSQYRT